MFMIFSTSLCAVSQPVNIDLAQSGLFVFLHDSRGPSLFFHFCGALADQLPGCLLGRKSAEKKHFASRAHRWSSMHRSLLDEIGIHHFSMI
jgi:hypothetical protein